MRLFTRSDGLAVTAQDCLNIAIETLEMYEGDVPHEDTATTIAIAQTYALIAIAMNTMPEE